MPARLPTKPRISYLIGRLHRVLRSALDEGIRAHGLTVAQYTALSILGDRPGLSNAQLARRSFMSAQSANQVMHVLEDLKLVRRNVDPNHGRIARAELTARGRTVLSACEQVVDACEIALWRSVPRTRQEQLMNDLRSCLRALDSSYSG
jgi:DNA-binding MarR family transcriptional regulator